MSDESIGASRDGRVAVITINRPERRNALNLAALEALDAATAAAVDDRVAAIVFRGEGGHFCAGADIKEVLEDESFDLRLREVLEHVAGVPVPTIAAISGACMGLGMQLALACDLRVATDDAYFGIPAGKLGLVVNHWTLRRLTRALGVGHARLMVLAAETFPSEEMRRLGFTQAQGDLDVALELAHRAESLAPLAVAGAKLGFERVERDETDDEFEAAFLRAWRSDDLQEGVRAFGERRAPNFEGR